MSKRIYIQYTDEMTERDALSAAYIVISKTKPAERKGIIVTGKAAIYFPERSKNLTMQIYADKDIHNH